MLLFDKYIGRHESIIQWWNKHKLIHFTVVGSQCQEHSCSAAIFNLLQFKDYPWQDLHLTTRAIITELLYGEASVMFRTLLANSLKGDLF